METQEQLLVCPHCGLEQPPEGARWNLQETAYEAICQECGKKFEGDLDDQMKQHAIPAKWRLEP